jgi:iron uptake system component EfeO
MLSWVERRDAKHREDGYRQLAGIARGEQENFGTGARRRLVVDRAGYDAAVMRATVVVVTMAMLSLAACTSSTSPQTISVSSEHCGEGWTQPHGGQQTFTLRNDDIATAEVYLTDAKTGDVYAYVDDVAPGSTAQLRIDLGGGRYSFRCAIEDRGVAVGPSVSIVGPAASGSPPVRPVAANDLIPLTKEYDSWVSVRLVRLESLVAALNTDMGAVDNDRAKSDWLAAHILWEQLGAAYNSFGAQGTAVDDGFHEVESELWGTAGPPNGPSLVTAVTDLAEAFDQSQVEPLDLTIRAHEIVEDALRFELTGKNDYGSGSTFSTIGANLAGTAEVIGLLEPLLAPRYPALHRLLAMMSTTTTDVDALEGRSLAQLTTAQRERVNADLSQLAEELAPVASICEPRRTT